MSNVGSSEPIPSSPTVSKAKKSRKKKPGGNGKLNGIPEKLNGNKNEVGGLLDDDELEEPETPIAAAYLPRSPDGLAVNGSGSHAVNGSSSTLGDASLETLRISEQDSVPKSPTTTRTAKALDAKDKALGIPVSSSQANEQDTKARLETLANERAALRDEVTRLRKSLEEIQGRHEEVLNETRLQLETTEGERDHAQTQYQNLMGKLNTIRSQLGERLKSDKEDLEQARIQIEELEQQNAGLQEQNNARAVQIAKFLEDSELSSKELSSLRNRMNLSQQNWVKEREEFDTTKQAMQDWEVLAMEERSIRENLEERVSDLEEQLTNHRNGHERAAAERDSQALTVDGLRRALQEIQEARRRELREVVENSQSQLEILEKDLHEAQAKAAESTKALEIAQKALERALPFEAEVKEKNLLIGKLRHEAVILNEHLTKALKRVLKKGKPEDNVDKQLITNHFLHFLGLERSDPKKFQVLQIMASLLGWTEEQREQAGLSRPGASNPNLRIPLSPWHRTPSTPSLSAEFFPESAKLRGDSIGGMWQEFLEQEAAGETSTHGRSSRSTSISSVLRTSH